MKRGLGFVTVLALLALFALGCSKGNDYQTGYAAYGQPVSQGQGGGQGQGYVGGGCGVAGPDIVEPINSQPQAAA